MVNSSSSEDYFNQVLEEMKKWEKPINKTILKRAFELCLDAHDGQKRASGEPYWIHPANVALILARYGADSETITAALLHDVLEDTKVPKKLIGKSFGKTVQRLVEGVTKLDHVAQLGRKNNSTYNVQRMMLAGSRDWRVLLIKLADRLHNLRTIEYLSASNQKRIAGESLLVHAPIAHKLGIHRLMAEIQETAFKALNREVYSTSIKRLEKTAKEREKTIRVIIAQLKEILPKSVRFSTLHKCSYQMYMKQTASHKEMASFSDVVVLCIETRSIPDCYSALGSLHLLYPPVPKKIKDFIAIPQPNLYSGLHTTVIGPDGRPIKVYIGTEKMFDLNNRGVLGLDENAYKLFPLIRQRVEKLNKLFRLPKHFSEADEFMYAMSRDFAPKTIFVFTTRGETVELPLGSTPVDFIFHQRPEDGHRLWKAKVNGQFVPLDYTLEAGDIVEALLSKHRQFSENWLSLANTQTAKKRIQSMAQKPTHERNMDITVWAKDQIGLLADLTNAFSKAQINVLATTSLTYKRKNITHFNIGSVPDSKLSAALQELQKLSSVNKIKIINLNEGRD